MAKKTEPTMIESLSKYWFIVAAVASVLAWLGKSTIDSTTEVVTIKRDIAELKKATDDVKELRDDVRQNTNDNKENQAKLAEFGGKLDTLSLDVKALNSQMQTLVASIKK